jgi:hypothetical protein
VKAPTIAAVNQAPCQRVKEASLTLVTPPRYPIPVNSSFEQPAKSGREAARASFLIGDMG